VSDLKNALVVCKDYSYLPLGLVLTQQPMSAPRDVLLVGLGAVGAIYAFVLQRSGIARVSIVARSNCDTVKADGLDIKSQRYGETKSWKPYRVLSSVAEAADRAYSHVVVTTKVVTELQRTSELLSPLLSQAYTEKYAQPTYVLMQNGINIEVDLWDALKSLQPEREPRILGTSLWIGTRMVGYNIVEHSDFDRVSLGVYRSQPNITTNSPSELSLLQEFGDMLSAGGTEVIIVPEIHRVKFRKNALNCWMNPITALVRISFQGMFRKPEGAETPNTSPEDAISEPTPSQIATASIPASFPSVSRYTIPALYDILTEVTALGRALYPSSSEDPGIDPQLPASVLTSISDIGMKPTSDEKPSMQVDVEMGRPTELEVVLGEMVRAGRRVGVPVPRLETIYAMMLIVQAHLLYQQKQKASIKATSKI